MRKTLALAALLLALGIAPLAAASARVINYQGQLTDLSDNTISGTQNMAFELYNTLSGGSPIFSWATTGVPVTRGLFNVELTLPTLSSTDLAGDLYLQVTVAGNVMSPRKRILTSIYAVSADSLQGIVTGSSAGNIPVILTSTGKLDPSILSAPFPLVVSGTGSAMAAAGIFDNQDPGAGQTGLKSTGQDYGVNATVRGGNGTAVRGSTIDLVGDAGASTGVYGIANNGVGVRAYAGVAGTTALLASNPQGLSIYGGGGPIGALLGGTDTGLIVGSATSVGGQTAALPVTGILVNSSGTGIQINNQGSNAAVLAQNFSNGVAISGKANGANSIALRGEHTGVGNGFGVWGLSNSDGGTGVRGEAGSTTGNGVGVDGAAASPSAVGVRGSGPGVGVDGRSSSTGAGTAYGVQGTALAPDGQGLHGVAEGSGLAYGVYGQALASAGGAGVYGTGQQNGVQGVANGASGGTIGVSGTAPDRGVVGTASASASIGVQGSTTGANGIGVQGSGSAFGVKADGATGVYGSGTSLGVYGVSSAGNGHGVEGYGGPAGAGLNRAGLYGSIDVANGELGYGLYATVNGSTGDGYAIWAQVNQPNHRAIRAYNTAATGSQSGYALGVEGKLKIGGDNAGLYSSNALGQTSWLVSSGYCGAGDLVLITPASDITKGGTVTNSLYVNPTEVLDGNFTVHSINPVDKAQFFYLVIDHN
jgi:hypothetical protein